MKIAWISLFACLAAVKGSSLPQSRIGVTSNEIDTLIGDYLFSIRQTAETIVRNEYVIPVKHDKVDLKLTLLVEVLKVGETKDYVESSSLTSNQLSASVSLKILNTQVIGVLHVGGTINGQSVNQTGDILLSWDIGTHVSSLKASFGDKWVTCDEIKVEHTLAPTVARISGIQIPGVTQEEGEKALGTILDKEIKNTNDRLLQMLQAYIPFENELMNHHTLQEVYDQWRNQIPRSST